MVFIPESSWNCHSRIATKQAFANELESSFQNFLLCFLFLKVPKIIIRECPQNEHSRMGCNRHLRSISETIVFRLCNISETGRQVGRSRAGVREGAGQEGRSRAGAEVGRELGRRRSRAGGGKSVLGHKSVLGQFIKIINAKNKPRVILKLCKSEIRCPYEIVLMKKLFSLL